MLDELLATVGVEERIVARSRFGLCALHGGLEQGTAEIAEAAADAAGASFYAVVQPEDLHWHVPSHRYDPALSDGLRAFLAGIDVVISVHGFGGVRDADDRWTTALLGGTNRELAAELRGASDAGAPAIPLDRRSRGDAPASARLAPREPGEPSRAGRGAAGAAAPRAPHRPRLRRVGHCSCRSGSRCATSL